MRAFQIAGEAEFVARAVRWQSQLIRLPEIKGQRPNVFVRARGERLSRLVEACGAVALAQLNTHTRDQLRADRLVHG